MKTVRAQMCFETNNEEELMKCINHHMERLIDFDSRRDIVSSVHGAISYEVTEACDNTKLNMLAEILQDISTPTDDEFDDMEDEDVEMYKRIISLKNAMAECGLM